MSGQLTQFGRNRAIEAGLGGSVAAASGMYIALLTALPATPQTDSLATFAANEVSTAGYSRQGVTWSAASDGSEENDADLTFGPFSADPPSVGYAMLCDTSIGTSGNVIAYWTVDTPRDASTGDSLRFTAGELVMAVPAA